MCTLCEPELSGAMVTQDQVFSAGNCGMAPFVADFTPLLYGYRSFHRADWIQIMP